jgi:hypothetical protein
VPEQSADVRQRTQVDVCKSHTGAAAVVHWLFIKQPARHWPLPPQMGVFPLHCEFVPHWTHVPFRQCGVVPEQSPSVAQATHRREFESQTWRMLGQSEPVMHPTHALVEGSQRGVRPLQRAAPPASPGEQAARQVWVDG